MGDLMTKIVQHIKLDNAVFEVSRNMQPFSSCLTWKVIYVDVKIRKIHQERGKYVERLGVVPINFLNISRCHSHFFGPIALKSILEQ